MIKCLLYINAMFKLFKHICVSFYLIYLDASKHVGELALTYTHEHLNTSFIYFKLRCKNIDKLSSIYVPTYKYSQLY